MSSVLPDANRFETPVYGTIFAERARAVDRLHTGDTLILVPDPAVPEPSGDLEGSPHVAEEPKVWVHALGGDVVGYLSPDINRWLVRRMLSGHRYAATVQSLGDPSDASWRRLMILVTRVEGQGEG